MKKVNRKEYVFYRIDVAWSNLAPYGSEIRFCAHGRRSAESYVRIPDNVDRIYLVFTRWPRTDSFETRADGTIYHVRAALYYSFQTLLRRHHRRGLRYFHFEYDA